MAKCQGMPLSMWYTKFSAKSLAVFLPTHCQDKLKKSEYALAFYCWHTEQLNFKSCYIQDYNRGIDDWEVTLFEKCEMHKQLKERCFGNTNKTVYHFSHFKTKRQKLQIFEIFLDNLEFYVCALFIGKTSFWKFWLEYRESSRAIRHMSHSLNELFCWTGVS